MKFQTITGFRDILPPESALWNRVEHTAREVFGTYGYGEIRLPIVELTELFARSIGAETDVVAKEMYTFPDHNLWELEGQRKRSFCSDDRPEENKSRSRSSHAKPLDLIALVGQFSAAQWLDAEDRRQPESTRHSEGNCR